MQFWKERLRWLRFTQGRGGSDYSVATAIHRFIFSEMATYCVSLPSVSSKGRSSWRGHTSWDIAAQPAPLDIALYFANAKSALRERMPSDAKSSRKSCPGILRPLRLWDRRTSLEMMRQIRNSWKYLIIIPETLAKVICLVRGWVGQPASLTNTIVDEKDTLFSRRNISYM